MKKGSKMSLKQRKAIGAKVRAAIARKKAIGLTAQLLPNLITVESVPASSVEGYKNPLLNERARTHGDFRDHAEFVDVVMGAIARYKNKNIPFSNVQNTGLTNIVGKVARAVVGNPNVAEHWDDIAGYAQLVSHDLQR